MDPDMDNSIRLGYRYNCCHNAWIRVQSCEVYCDARGADDAREFSAWRRAVDQAKPTRFFVDGEVVVEVEAVLRFCFFSLAFAASLAFVSAWRQI